MTVYNFKEVTFSNKIEKNYDDNKLTDTGLGSHWDCGRLFLTMQTIPP